MTIEEIKNLPEKEQIYVILNIMQTEPDSFTTEEWKELLNVT